jgi:hypothetical protein
LEPIAKAFAALYFLSPVLYYAILLGLLGILGLLVAHIVITFRRALQSRLPKGDYNASGDSAAPPDYWEEEAENAIKAADYVWALRCWLKAALLRLEQTRRGVLRKGSTNREYLRKFENTPVAPPLRMLVDGVDKHWYGGAPLDAASLQAYREAHSSMITAARLLPNA